MNRSKIIEMRDGFVKELLMGEKPNNILSILYELQETVSSSCTEAENPREFAQICQELSLTRPPQMPTPEAYAKGAYSHELAHQKAYSRYGVSSTIHVGALEDGQPVSICLADIDDLTEIAEKNHNLREVFGNVFLAPKIYNALPYDEETRLGNLLLLDPEDLEF